MEESITRTCIHSACIYAFVVVMMRVNAFFSHTQTQHAFTLSLVSRSKISFFQTAFFLFPRKRKKAVWRLRWKKKKSGLATRDYLVAGLYCSYILLCQKSISLYYYTFQSNILHNLVTTYLYFTYEYLAERFFSLQ